MVYFEVNDGIRNQSAIEMGDKPNLSSGAKRKSKRD